MTFVHIKKLTSLDLSLLTYLKQTNEKASRKESIAKTTLYTFQTESTRKEKKRRKTGMEAHIPTAHRKHLSRIKRVPKV